MTNPKHQHVLDELGAAIVNGCRTPGEHLTLEAVQAQFGVSRTVARDVARSLASLGLVEARRRVGLIIQPPARWSVLAPQVISWQLAGKNRHEHFVALTQLRVAVEPLAAARAAELMSADAKEELRAVGERLQRHGTAGQLDDFLRADQELHALILRGSGNPIFASFDAVVGEVLAERTRQGLMPQAPKPQALALHAALVEHLCAGQATLAEAAMRELVAEVRDAMGW